MPPKKATKSAKTPPKSSSATAKYAKTSRRDGKGRVVYTRGGKDYTRHKKADGTFGMRAATGGTKVGNMVLGGGWVLPNFFLPEDPKKKPRVKLDENSRVYIVMWLQDTRKRAYLLLTNYFLNSKYNISLGIQEEATKTLYNTLYEDITWLIEEVVKYPAGKGEMYQPSGPIKVLTNRKRVGRADSDVDYAHRDLENMLEDIHLAYADIINSYIIEPGFFNEDLVIKAKHNLLEFKEKVGGLDGRTKEDIERNDGPLKLDKATKEYIINMLEDTKNRGSHLFWNGFNNSTFIFSDATIRLAHTCLNEILQTNIRKLIERVKSSPAGDGERFSPSFESHYLAESNAVGIAGNGKKHEPEEILAMLDDTRGRYKDIVQFYVLPPGMFILHTQTEAAKDYNSFLEEYKKLLESATRNIDTK